MVKCYNSNLSLDENISHILRMGLFEEKSLITKFQNKRYNNKKKTETFILLCSRAKAGVKLNGVEEEEGIFYRHTASYSCNQQVVGKTY